MIDITKKTTQTKEPEVVAPVTVTPEVVAPEVMLPKPEVILEGYIHYQKAQRKLRIESRDGLAFLFISGKLFEKQKRFHQVRDFMREMNGEYFTNEDRWKSGSGNFIADHILDMDLGTRTEFQYG